MRQCGASSLVAGTRQLRAAEWLPLPRGAVRVTGTQLLLCEPTEVTAELAAGQCGLLAGRYRHGADLIIKCKT
jgi:hypothetical protein